MFSVKEISNFKLNKNIMQLIRDQMFIKQTYKLTRI